MRFFVVLLLIFSELAFKYGTASLQLSDLMALTSEDGVPYFCDWISGEFRCGRFGITDMSELTSSTVLLSEGAEIIPSDMALVADGYVWKFDTGSSVPVVIITYENGDIERFMYSEWFQKLKLHQSQ